MHYHVITGGPDGPIIREQPFEDGYESVRAFIGIAKKLFGDSICSDPVVTELALLEYVNTQENDVAVHVTVGPMKLMWAPCEGCVPAMWN